MTPAARAFLALHAAPTPPHTWRWHFLDTQLRASGDAGCVTIWADELDDLVEAGLLGRGPGCADCYITPEGREAVL
jgi:hypothetical protein